MICARLEDWNSCKYGEALRVFYVEYVIPDDATPGTCPWSRKS